MGYQKEMHSRERKQEFKGFKVGLGWPCSRDTEQDPGEQEGR